MKKGQRTIGIIKRVFNVRQWMDIDRSKDFMTYIGQGLKSMFIIQKPTGNQESFAHAMKKLNLTDENLYAKQISLWRLSLLMTLIAILIFVYSMYQLFFGSWHATLVSLVIVILSLVLAFRYNFWYFQIKHKKLGVSFREWFKKGLMGKKDDK